MKTKTTLQELMKSFDAYQLESKSESITIEKLKEVIIKEYLEKEKQIGKNRCIEFSRYIRNGNDKFHNGYSTEMVYDEWEQSSIVLTDIDRARDFRNDIKKRGGIAMMCMVIE